MDRASFPSALLPHQPAPPHEQDGKAGGNGTAQPRLLRSGSAGGTLALIGPAPPGVRRTSQAPEQTAPQQQDMPPHSAPDYLPVYDDLKLALQASQGDAIDPAGGGGGVLTDLMGLIHGFALPVQRKADLRVLSSKVDPTMSRTYSGPDAPKREAIARLPSGAFDVAVGELVVVDGESGKPAGVYMGLGETGAFWRRWHWVRTLERVNSGSRPSPDGFGYVTQVLHLSRAEGTRRRPPLPGADVPRLRVGTRLLVALPVGAGQKLPAARPALFLGARLDSDGLLVLRARAPWTPQPAGHDQPAQASPRRIECAIGPGPGYASAALGVSSEGWFEWEATLPCGTVLAQDGCFVQEYCPFDEAPPPMEDVKSGPAHRPQAPPRDEKQQMPGAPARRSAADTVQNPASVSQGPLPQFAGMPQGTRLEVRFNDTPFAVEFAGEDSEPNQIWVVAPRGQSMGQLRSALVPVGPGGGASTEESYLIALNTHRVYGREGGE